MGKTANSWPHWDPYVYEKMRINYLFFPGDLWLKL